ncbi:MAG: hypothetical protein AUH46_02205 [Gemmatimonadetes bacterium 13_1_40CM_70_15]|nr:MAG: hypothetical protein AUH46_02205 [Gemmatimonadetes bacterium 13_1_40CM_70_15]
MQSGRWRVAVPGRAVGLELVEAIQRDVESVAALVLEHRHIQRPVADGDRLQPAVNADAVLQMDHVAAERERLRPRGGGGAGRG